MARPVRHRGKWRIRWVDEDHHRRSEVYPEYRDALFKLREYEHQVEEIKRGLRSPAPPSKTFDDIADYWLTRRAVNKRSGKSDESIIRVHLRPFFTGMLLAKIRVEDVDGFRAAKAHMHKNTLHHLLTLLISLLRLAQELDWLRKIPKIKKPKIRLFNKDFHYLRTQEELTLFLRAAAEAGDLEYALYATAVFTGMRQGELAGLLWSKVNFEERLIAVDKSWDGETKNGEVRYVPILDPLLPILREWRLKNSARYVFANQDGGMFIQAARIFGEKFHAILDRAGFPKVERLGKQRRYIRFHDLRHTFASHWMMNGGDLFRLQQILGHASPQMTMRYAHFAPAAFASDYGRLGAARTTKAGVVVEFPQRGPGDRAALQDQRAGMQET
jgi:integrase